MKKIIKGFAGKFLDARQRKRARYHFVTALEAFGFPQLPAHNRLDRKLLRYLGDRHRGVFIEVGANDGLSQSNTWFLERQLGWTGLLIEPIPWIADICRRQRRAVVESCALGSFAQEGTDLELYYGALMTVARDAPSDHLSERDARVHAQEGASWVGESASLFKTKVHALSTLLDKHGLAEVDLLSLDVEGYEVRALNGIDFGRHVINYILIETNNVPSVEAVIGHQYSLIERFSSHDCFYKRVRVG
jgi:FkbM family methyltransferase